MLRHIALVAAVVLAVTCTACAQEPSKGSAVPSPAGTKAASADTPFLDEYHKWYYSNEKQTFGDVRWFGATVFKMPLDLWVLQEILYDTKPDVLIECGTYKGGSAFYFASLMDLLKKGRVITIDIQEYPDRPRHPRITYLLGSSTSDEIFKKVRAQIPRGAAVMVDLDSDHRKEHVLNELKLYSQLVTKGQYLVVEDTNVNGHPVVPQFGPGPMEALEEFLKGNSDFVSDRSKEKHGVSFNPKGYLKRVK